jgi:hypothetical protein
MLHGCFIQSYLDPVFFHKKELMKCANVTGCFIFQGCPVDQVKP